MSVGHYIAYTCSLDIYNEYVSCGHDKRRLSLTNAANKMKPSTHGSLSSSGGGEKNSGLMKKLIYGRSKASSSGDMSKNLKPINGLSKIMMNGIEKLNLNSEKLSATNGNGQLNGTNASQKSSSSPKTVCGSANCCGIYVKDFSNIVENYHNNTLNSEKNGGEKIENNSGDDTTNNSMTSDYESASSQKPSMNDLNQKVWYMCDDDKIKIMTQREFEEALSKNQKVMITPYLLFYARFDVNKQTSNISSNNVDHD
jgi:ubiquitin carboxyl-terminal hydrolase 1